MPSFEKHHVVVGIDGTPPSDRALDVAVDEAVLRDRPLQIVLVSAPVVPFPSEAGVVPYGALGPMPTMHPPAEQDDYLEELAREDRNRVDHAVGRASLRLPTERVSGEVVDGSPAKVLVERSIGAHLVVVGSREHSTIRSVLLGSVSAGVAAHASCPVLVVRGASLIGREVGGDTGRVVIGADGSEHMDQTIAHGLRAAALRGLPVHVVHCWERVGFGDWSQDQLQAERARREELIDRRIASISGTYPDVPITVDVIEAKASSALAEQSESATMVVVGSRGHSGLTGLLLGSVGQAVLHHSACSVLVVHPER